MENRIKIIAAAIAKEEDRTIENVLIEINTKRTLGSAIFKNKKKKLKTAKKSKRANR